jgi:hypothetical protein
MEQTATAIKVPEAIKPGRWAFMVHTKKGQLAEQPRQTHCEVGTSCATTYPSLRGARPRQHLEQFLEYSTDALGELAYSLCSADRNIRILGLGLQRLCQRKRPRQLGGERQRRRRPLVAPLATSPVPFTAPVPTAPARAPSSRAAPGSDSQPRCRL